MLLSHKFRTTYKTRAKFRIALHETNTTDERVETVDDGNICQDYVVETFRFRSSARSLVVRKACEFFFHPRHSSDAHAYRSPRACQVLDEPCLARRSLHEASRRDFRTSGRSRRRPARRRATRRGIPIGFGGRRLRTERWWTAFGNRTGPRETIMIFASSGSTATWGRVVFE